MLVIPSVNLKDGLFVKQVVDEIRGPIPLGSDPIEMAEQWHEASCRRMHLVDFNGAFSGQSNNIAAIKKVANMYPNLLLQVSGGIRSLETIRAYIDAGVSWVVIGTKELLKAGFVGEACKHFPGQIIAGVDAFNGKVATHAWSKISDITSFELALELEQAGVSAIVYTDMSCNNLTQKINVDATIQLANYLTMPVIVSGGVHSMSDIRELKAVAHYGLKGVITGRAIDDGTLNFREAQRFCDE